MLDEMTCRQKASNSIFSLNEFAGHHRGKKFKAKHKMGNGKKPLFYIILPI